MEGECCACCGEKFAKKGKQKLRRYGLFTAVKEGPSAAETLEKFGANVTPGKKAYLCVQCNLTIKSLDVKQTQLREVEEKFRKIRKPGTYVTAKVPTTPSHRRTPKKRKVISSKVLSPKAPTATKSSDHGQGKMTITVRDTALGKALMCISNYKYKRGFQKLVSKSKVAKRAMVDVMCGVIRKEMAKFSRKISDNSLASVLSFDWETVFSDADKECPATKEFVTAALTKSTRKRKETELAKVLPVIGSVLQIMAFKRCVRNNLFQQIVSILLWLGGCKRKIFKSLNKMGWCQSIHTTTKRIDGLRLGFDKKVKCWRDTLSAAETGMKEKSDEEGQALLELEDIWEDIEEVVVESADSISDSVHTEGLSSDFPSTTTDTTTSEGTLDKSEATLSSQSSSTSASSLASDLQTGSPHHQKLYYDLTFDNVNQKISVRHHIRGKKSNMLNLVQAYATLERIGSYGMSNTTPSAEDIKNLSVADLLPTQTDEALLREELEIMVSRILTKEIPAFQGLETVWSIPHQFSRESAIKSETVALGVLNKDETKTADMIEILESYQQYVPRDKSDAPLPLLVNCDGLSCERVSGAKRARINGEDNWAQLGMFEPCIQEWHRRLMHLQDTYDELFKFESQREKGSLYNLKQVYDHTGVSKNIVQCFDKAEELLEFATDGYTVLFAMDLCMMDTVADIPILFPKDEAGRKQFRDNISQKIVETILYIPNTAEVINVAVDSDVESGVNCICKLDIGGTMVFCNNKACQNGVWFHLDCIGMEEDQIPEGDWFCSEECTMQHEVQARKKKNKVVDKFKDLKFEYVRRLLWRGLCTKARHDAVKENDGPRLIRHWKFDLFEFHEKNHPKYFIYAHRLLTSVAGGVSERLIHNLVWERTVNTKGGKRHNIPKDLHCEHLNKAYKENSKASAGQLTEETIKRYSQMLDIQNAVLSVFEKKASGTSTYTRKHGKIDRTKDIRRMVMTLKGEKLFQRRIGRAFKGFEDFSPVRGVRSPVKFKQRLMTHLQIRAELRALNML